LKTYFHHEIGYEIRSISGSLTVLEEKVLDFQGRELLCIVQVGIIDNACCGSGGCLMVEVPGYLFSRGIDDRRRRISQVLPVEGDQEKAEITAVLNKIYPYAQFRFA
jgi:hypothetical protein